MAATYGRLVAIDVKPGSSSDSQSGLNLLKPTIYGRLAAEGCSILYISHKLDEILALCTRATVLRAGRVTGSCDPRQETSSSLAKSPSRTPMRASARIR